MIGVIYVVALVVVGGALGIVLTGATPWMGGTEVKAEVVKVAIQVVVFGLAGGAVKLLLDRQAEARRFRVDVLERIGRAHKDVYRVRRLLAAAPPDAARELLGELMNARQELGAAYHLMRVWGLGGKVADVQQETEAMRSYLEEVIIGASASDGTPERGAYTAFLAWRQPGPYEDRFKAPYKRAKGLVDPNFRPDEESRSESPMTAEPTSIATVAMPPK
jgi:hypothetical protein